jgi:hypothetical protein
MKMEYQTFADELLAKTADARSQWEQFEQQFKAAMLDEAAKGNGCYMEPLHKLRMESYSKYQFRIIQIKRLAKNYDLKYSWDDEHDSHGVIWLDD